MLTHDYCLDLDAPFFDSTGDLNRTRDDAGVSSDLLFVTTGDGYNLREIAANA